MIRFCYNPTSWRDGAPVPGGMADALVRPILPHLASDYELVDFPAPNIVNVYYAFRSQYSNHYPSGETAVFVSHGIADKAWRNARKLRGDRFDWVFVSGPAWTARLAEDRWPIERICEVGYAKLDPIFQGKVKPLRPKDGRIRVVWAPTHGGGGEPRRLTQAMPGQPVSEVSTYGRRDAVLELLPSSEFDIIEAVHPRHRPDGKATLAEYVDADVVIADGGSTIYEAWALDIPVVFPYWLTATANIARAAHRRVETFEAIIYREQIGRHTHRPEDLARLIVDAAEHGITSQEQTFIEAIFPRAYRGVSGRMHAEALDDIAAGVDPVRHVAGPRYVEHRHIELGKVRRVIEGSPRDVKLRNHPLWELLEEVPA